MRKHIINLTAAVITSILGACSGGSESGLPTLDLAGNLQCDDTGELSDIFLVERTLLPQLTDSTMLSFPKRAGREGSEIYLVQGTRLLRYDSETGECLSSFDHSGEGPGEYMDGSLSIYKVPEEDHWMVYETNSRKVLFYTPDGNLISEKDCVEKFSEVLPCGEGWLGLKSVLESDSKIFVRLTADFEVIDSIVGRYPVHRMKENICIVPDLTISGKDVIFVENGGPSDTIFSISSTGDMNPLAAVNLGNLKMPKFDSYETYSQERSKYLTYRTFVVGNLVVIMYRYDEKQTCQIYSLPAGELLFSRTGESSGGLPIEIDGHHLNGFPMSYNGKKTLYLLVRGEEVEGINGDSESNPMFVKLRLKQPLPRQ